MKAGNSEEIVSLSLGWIVGGSTAANRPWENAIKDLCQRISDVRTDATASLNLNVVFHVPGNLLKPEHTGLRTGRYSRREATLMIQVAVPEEVPLSPEKYIKDSVYAAIDEAARWAAKRKIHFDALKLREVLDHA